ncbi:hypothetical protein EMPS_07714 [Entomortierella parvispora]|uniref:Uncharacterized protein n=1 Tax=Entomortierella parvispora TaxID=205924 RepID=A0A9P3LYE6_9FUNG|nr:hypothetical protein EMPS_07714 [Entomortierella parvispora]
MIEINSYADGKLISMETINQWEAKRLVVVMDLIHRLLDIKPPPADKKDTRTREEQIDDLTELKIKHSDKILKKMEFYFCISGIATWIPSFLSFGKRKFSAVDVVISGTDLSIATFKQRMDLLMLDEDLQYVKMRLAACPDHHLLANVDEYTMVVVEATGGSPMPSRFYIRSGDMEGLRSVTEPGFEILMIGAARIQGGRVIGGIRHQIRKEGDSLKLKFLVEFPFLLPDFMIKQHQLHLMCEFNHWVRNVLSMRP